MNTNELSKELLNSIENIPEKSILTNSLIDISEVAMDTIIGIPIISLIRKMFSLNEYFFEKKIISFLLDISSVSDKQRIKFISKIRIEDEDFGIKLLRVIERIDDEKISKYYNVWFKCFLEEKINKNLFNRGSSILQKIYIEDLEFFLKSDESELSSTASSEEHPNEILFPSIHNGLIGYGYNIPQINSHWEFNEVTFTSTTWITEVGKEFRKHLSI